MRKREFRWTTKLIQVLLKEDDDDENKLPQKRTQGTKIEIQGVVERMRSWWR